MKTPSGYLFQFKFGTVQCEKGDGYYISHYKSPEWKRGDIRRKLAKFELEMIDRGGIELVDETIKALRSTEDPDLREVIDSIDKTDMTVENKNATVAIFGYLTKIRTKKETNELKKAYIEQCA